MVKGLTIQQVWTCIGLIKFCMTHIMFDPIKSLSLSKFPARSVLELTEELISSVTNDQLNSAHGQLMQINDHFANIEKLGTRYIHSTASPISESNK